MLGQFLMRHGSAAQTLSSFGVNLRHFWGDQYSTPTSTTSLWVDEIAGANFIEEFADTERPVVDVVNGHNYPKKLPFTGQSGALQRVNVPTFDGASSIALFGCFRHDDITNHEGGVWAISSTAGVSFEIMDEGNPGVYTIRIHLDWNPSNAPATSIYTGPGNAFAQGQWHYFVWVVDDLVNRFYLNGAHVPALDTVWPGPLDDNTGAADWYALRGTYHGSMPGGVTCMGLLDRAPSTFERNKLEGFMKNWLGI